MISRVLKASWALALPFLLALGWMGVWKGGFAGVVGWHVLVDLGPRVGVFGVVLWVVSRIRARATAGGRPTPRRGARSLVALHLCACAGAMLPALTAFGMAVPLPDAHEPAVLVSAPSLCSGVSGEPLRGSTPEQRWAWTFHSVPVADWRSKEDDPCWGTPAVAPAAGVVYAVRDGAADREPGSGEEGDGPGNTVSIRLVDGTFLTLGHLREHSIVALPGEHIGEGALLAQLGSSGDASTPGVYLRREREPADALTGWVESLPIELANGRTVDYPGSPSDPVEIDFADPSPIPTCGSNSDCSTGDMCARLGNGRLNVLGCVSGPKPAAIAYRLPIVAGGGVRCGQGHDQLDHTHSYPNTLFAVDLASPRDGPAGEVVAAADGVVANVFAGCVDPGVVEGHGDSCGGGFGNALLRRLLVANGAAG